MHSTLGGRSRIGVGWLQRDTRFGVLLVMRTYIIGLFIVGLAARAAADPLVAAGISEHQPVDLSGLPDHGLHFDFGVGVDIGRINAGDMTATTGFHAILGPRMGRVALLAEVDLAATQSRLNAMTLGAYERVALETRVSLWQGRFGGLRFSGTPKVLDRGDLWIEAGIGHERASQMDNSVLERNDVSFGIGFQRTFHHASHTFGLYFGVRVIEAEPASSDRSHSRSVLLMSGVTF